MLIFSFLVKDFEVEKALRVSRLPPEPQAGDPAAMQVVLRLPSGYRLERWFRSSDTLQVYYFTVTVLWGYLINNAPCGTKSKINEVQLSILTFLE